MLTAQTTIFRDFAPETVAVDPLPRIALAAEAMAVWFASENWLSPVSEGPSD